MENKCCAKCKLTKPVADFGTNKARKDGLQTYCRICKSGKPKDKSTKPAPASSFVISEKNWNESQEQIQWLIDEVEKLKQIESSFLVLFRYVVALSKNPRNPPPLPKFLGGPTSADEDDGELTEF